MRHTTIGLAICAIVALSGYGAPAPDPVGKLRDYIKVDTTNPPGNESRAVDYFKKIFDAAGIRYDTAESAPGRGNIWARLDGGNEPALVLLNHMDVVPADRRYWTEDPFAGTVKDGYLYGRGALDMKSLGIAELEAFLHLHASGKKLNRDVIFVGTADEEAGGNMGAGWLAEHHPEIFEGVGFLVNEGGGGRHRGDKLVFGVGVAEKVPLWLRITTHGPAGHGSVPRVETAITRLLRAGNRLATADFPARVVPATEAMFKGLAAFQSEPVAARYAAIAESVKDPDFLLELKAAEPGDYALLHDTCSITSLEGSSKVNVIPPQASMDVDCRLLPDQDPEAFIADLRKLFVDPTIEIEKLLSFAPAASPTDTPLYALFEEVATTAFPGAVVIPTVSTGFTDSHFFRERGIVSYGASFFVIEKDDVRRAHGNDERIAVETLERGTALMIEMLERFTSQRTR
jgi:acetylornithine deacetylase/succinyl-diaminopimelate desuccinylase-like protein